MSKETKHRKDERKKPQLSLKEKRARKHEKREGKGKEFTDELIVE